MDTNNDSTGALRSLYEALEIPQTGAIDCFAKAKRKPNCSHKLPDERVDIDDLVKRLVLTESYDKHSNGLNITHHSAIKELAGKLVCSTNSLHSIRVLVDSKKYLPQEQFVQSVLILRFERWKSENPSQNQSTKHSTATRSPIRSLPSRPIAECTSKHRRTSGRSQRVNDSDEDTETDAGYSSEASTQMSLRRPKLVRENHRDEQETLMTPVRGRGYRLHNNYVDVSKVLQEPRNLYPSPDFDQSVFSLGSVASPGASEVFSPISAASTPDSVYSTTGFGSPLSSFRGSSRRMRNEESPTRHGECDDISFLTREMARKMKLCEDNSSTKDNLIDGEAVGDKNNIIGEGDEESNDESDDRCDEVSPAEEPTHSSSSRQLMKFSPREHKLPTKRIFDCMKTRLAKKKHGYIYCFAEKSAPGYLKIGHSESDPMEGDMEAPVSSTMKRTKDDKVQERILYWRRTCKHEIDLKFRIFMPCAVAKMEKLIHRTLHIEHRFAKCPAPKCGRRHQEWFETSVEEALRVTKVWQEFSKLKPYEDSGELNIKWWDLASGCQKEPGKSHSANTEWLTVWNQKLTRMGEESIKERKEALLDRLKEAEESTKWAERQLRKAEEEEEFIRRGLSELKIGDQ